MIEIVDALLRFAEDALKIPRDAFFAPEEGNETEGETSWRISLKSKPEFFFWFRYVPVNILDEDDKGLLYECNPRMKKYTWGKHGRSITKKDYLPDLKTIFKEWFLEKNNSINVLFPDDKINYPEDTTSEEKLYLFNILKETGAKPYKEYIFFELKSREGNDNNPWFAIQRVGKKQFFRTKWNTEPTPFHYRPGNKEAETNNSQDIRLTSTNPIEKGRMRKNHIENFAIWINRILSLEEAERNLKLLQEDNEEINIPPIQPRYITPEFKDEISDNGFFPFIDLTANDDSPPLTREERNEIREMLRLWRESADADEEVSEMTRDKFDEAVSTADLIISKNKDAPRNSIGKVIGNVWKVAKEEGIKVVVRKGLENAPEWIVEHLPKLLDKF